MTQIETMIKPYCISNDIAGKPVTLVYAHTPTLAETVSQLSNTLAVNHAPIDPAVAYRFTYKGRSLLISGDTVKSTNIEKFAKGVDLLVHEALPPNLVTLMSKVAKKVGNAPMEKITRDIIDYHTSPVEAAETARDAGVGYLLYYYIVPPLVIPGQKALFLNGAEKIFKNYTIGEDGVAFSLPTGSEKIIQTSDSL
ncbi:MAG: ribonuclease Z [Zhongshania sp.]